MRQTRERQTEDRREIVPPLPADDGPEIPKTATRVVGKPEEPGPKPRRAAKRGLTDTGIRAVSVANGVAWIALLSLALPAGWTSDFLTDRGSTVFPYPFTIQNAMWIMWWFGLGEVFLAGRRANREQRRLRLRLLPEDEETMLRTKDLGRIRSTLRAHEDSLVGRLAVRAILQFQASGAIDRATAVLTTGLDLMQHELDTRYRTLQYLTWVLPTIGFVGTVVGIAAALAYMGAVTDAQDPGLLADLAARLGVAFHTTLLALLLSSVLVLATTIVQQREERILNQAGQYCLDNLINRLYEH